MKLCARATCGTRTHAVATSSPVNSSTTALLAARIITGNLSTRSTVMQSDAPAVTCYTADVSICSMICRLAAVEHRVPNCIQRNVDIECAMENYEAWFVTIQPKMTVPCMQYGDHIIGDSKDIMYFLSERHPDAGLYPADQRATIDTFLNLFYSKFGVIARFTFGNWVRESDKIREFIGRGKTEKSVEKLKTLIEENPALKDIGKRKLQSKEQFDFVGFMMSANLEAMDAGMKVVLDVVEASLEKSPLTFTFTFTFIFTLTLTLTLTLILILTGEPREELLRVRHHLYTG